VDNLEKYLYRILLGYYYIYVEDQKYKIYYPNIDVKYEAELLYDKIIEDNKYDKIYLTEHEINIYLQTNGIWTKEDTNRLKDCEKFLEESKIDLFVNFTNEKKKTQNKKNIQRATKDTEVLYNKKNSFNYLTITDHAASVKNEFILMHTIYNSFNKLVFDYNNYDTLDYHNLQKFIREVLENTIKPNLLRLLVKSDIWKSYCVASVLEKDIININDDYRHIINLHKMYDNVRQHPECPSNEIIDDDDALDGWFIYQNRKAEKEKKKNAIMNKFGNNMKNAGEVFLMTDDINERNDIYDLNDVQSRQNIRELINFSKQNPEGNINWQDISFVQRELRTQANQQAHQSIKRK
jgi:hypothetical protein